MRNVIASSVVIGLFASFSAAEQAQTGAPAFKACSLLPRDLVMKVSGDNVNKFVFDMPPQEEPVGKAGSACDYAGIRLQIDPFSWTALEASAKKHKMMPVSGVGDAAYFGSRNSQFAEMTGRVGRHTFTIQMGVPFESTPDQMKPNVIALAEAIVPKLR